MGVAVTVALIGVDRPVRALADPVGEGVADEAAFEQRADDAEITRIT
jgi:hypothetical protein